MSGPVELDPYSGSEPPSPRSVARFIGRAIGVLVGLAIGTLGFGFYMLRCFSTCPTDPAENAISQILTLSLVGLGAVVIVAAISLGTRWTLPGTWTIAGVGALMAVGGLVTVALAPSLRLPGDRTGSITLGIIDAAVGVGLVLIARWVRRRSEQRT